jgi:Asp-tRNA(Asn)/Glu-tRNA(Gln) amidotransferase A subunit family amidase
MKIGVVKEGFQQATAEAAVNESVKAAAHRFTSLGASVEEGSIPMHLVGPAIWVPLKLSVCPLRFFPEVAQLQHRIFWQWRKCPSLVLP